jgi:hypothetical protein
MPPNLTWDTAMLSQPLTNDGHAPSKRKIYRREYSLSREIVVVEALF